MSLNPPFLLEFKGVDLAIPDHKKCELEPKYKNEPKFMKINLLIPETNNKKMMTQVFIRIFFSLWVLSKCVWSRPVIGMTHFSPAQVPTSTIHFLPHQSPEKQIMERDGPYFQSIDKEFIHHDNNEGIRIRKLGQAQLGEPEPQLAAPESQGRIFPNSEQAKAIKVAKAKFALGSKYRVFENGATTRAPKEACDTFYFCGGQRFVDAHDNLLDQTGCCHCNVACCSSRPSNSADVGLGLAIGIGSVLAPGVAYYGGCLCLDVCEECENCMVPHLSDFSHCCTFRNILNIFSSKNPFNTWSFKNESRKITFKNPFSTCNIKNLFTAST